MSSKGVCILLPRVHLAKALRHVFTTRGWSQPAIRSPQGCHPCIGATRGESIRYPVKTARMFITGRLQPYGRVTNLYPAGSLQPVFL